MHEGSKEFLRFMSEKGFNVTSQRRVIAEVFFSLPGHQTLEEIYRHVAEQDKSIGQTTVYRTLKLLCEAGLAAELHFGDGMARYEPAHPNEHHDHLICRCCGRTVEIFDSRLEKIQHELAAERGFTLLGHVHVLYGLCQDCRSQKAFPE